MPTRARGRRLNVVHLVVAGAIGGAERFLVNLASRPEESGADHAVALMTPNPKLRQFFVSAGLNVIDRGPIRFNPLADLWHSLGPSDVAWLDRVLAAEGADVLHAHTFRSHLLAARSNARLDIPLVRTEHLAAHYHDSSCALLRTWSLRMTTRLVAVSGHVARTVAGIAPEIKDRIELIPNGIDLQHFREPLPSDSGVFTFAITSRLAAVKQIHLAIAALAATPNTRLLIAGAGPEEGRLKRAARRHHVEDRLQFLGFQSDVRGVIAASDAVINCSSDEGLPLAVLEAASMARPCIAFPAGGTPEVVIDGETGWIVREATADALAMRMLAASANRARAAAFGKNAQKKVTQEFGIGTMCRRYAATYESVLHAPSLQVAA